MMLLDSSVHMGGVANEVNAETCLCEAVAVLSHHFHMQSTWHTWCRDRTWGVCGTSGAEGNFDSLFVPPAQPSREAEAVCHLADEKLGVHAWHLLLHACLPLNDAFCRHWQVALVA